jgi:hypothetical protein
MDRSDSIAADDVEEAAVGCQPNFSVVIDETELPELVHEDLDSRSGAAVEADEDPTAPA